MIRRATMVLLAAGGIQSLYAQAPGIGAWESYTAMTSVRSIAVRSGTVLAATAGGMFSFRWGTETFERATNTNGLTTNDLTAVGLDTRGRTWVGASDGAVNVYDSAAGRWLLIDDIRLSNKIQRPIHRFRTHGCVFIWRSGFSNIALGVWGHVCKFRVRDLTGREGRCRCGGYCLGGNVFRHGRRLPPRGESIRSVLLDHIRHI